MQKFLKSLVTPPVFLNDENKTRSALYGHWIALAFMLIILIYEVGGKILSGEIVFNELDFVLISIFFVLLICWVQIGNGHVRGANTVLVLLLWVGINIIAFFGFGIRDSAFTANSKRGSKSSFDSCIERCV